MAFPNETKTHAGREDSVPGSDKGHAHSHAAHLGTEGNVRPSTVNIGKQGREAGSIQQPPQDPARNGKSRHRQ